MRTKSMVLAIILAMSWTGLAHAGTLYTQEELWAVGNLWKQTKAEWQGELARHEARLKEIDASSMPDKHKDFFRQKEARYHRAESQRLAQKRAQVQNVLIDEANARSRGGSHATSEEVHATLGTSVDDPSHRGIAGDLDAQGGARTTQKIKDTLNDMGLGDTPIIETAGTFELGDDMELCIHKSGIEPRVGDEFHHVKNNVDARNPEVYMSERMRNRAAGTKQVGTDYVEVQDHLKKARKGHMASDQQLIDHPDKMQSMAKGTKKTLEIGDVSDDELAAILKQRGIQDSPADFKKKLAGLKEQAVKISDPAEAGKIRDASQDIFNAAEQKAYKRAKNEIATKQKAIKTAEENLKKLDAMGDQPELAERKRKLRESIEERRRAFKEEVIDSQSKMKASKAANDEAFAAHHQQQADAHAKADPTVKQPDVAADGATRPATEVDSVKPGDAADHVKVKPDVPDAGGGTWNKVKSGAGKAMDGFGAVMDIADIGNACRKLEEYQEGKATLGEVVRAVVDMTPAGGLVGAAEKTATSASDYADASRAVKKANEQNMEAYLLAWEKQFRSAGLDRDDAKKYIANAVLSGNLAVLEAKADQLRAAGKKVDTPRLVVEDSPAPDGGAWYMWENTKEMGEGMWEGAKSGVTYIVTAPGRVVEAFGERELAEANLDYNAQTSQADMKTRLFRSLVNAGVDSQVALNAVHNGGDQLKRAASEARKNLAVAREKEAEEQAKREARAQRIAACNQRITGLRFMDLELTADPASPVPIPRDTPPDQEMELTVSLGDELPNRIEQLKRSIGGLAGTEPQITCSYTLSIKGAQPVGPGAWKLRLPARPDLYPITGRVSISITGLTGDLQPLTRVFSRTIRGGVLIKFADESISLTQDSYEFSDGGYGPIDAEVTGGSPDHAYFFMWTFDEGSQLTEEPQLLYDAGAGGEGERETRVTVALCDGETGCVLAEDSAPLTVTPIQGTVVELVRSGSGAEGEVWKTYVCDQIKTYTKAQAWGATAQKEIRQLEADGWVKVSRVKGQERDHSVYLYARPHGPTTWLDWECKMVEYEGHYAQGKKHGKWTQYETRRKNSLGMVTKEEYFANGERHGVSKSYIDGRLWGVANYRNGKKSGEATYYSTWAPGGIVEWYIFKDDERVESFLWKRNQSFRWDAQTEQLIPVVIYTKTTNSPGTSTIERYDQGFVITHRETYTDGKLTEKWNRDQ